MAPISSLLGLCLAILNAGCHRTPNLYSDYLRDRPAQATNFAMWNPDKSAIFIWNPESKERDNGKTILKPRNKWWFQKGRWERTALFPQAASTNQWTPAPAWNLSLASDGSTNRAYAKPESHP